MRHKRATLSEVDKACGSCQHQLDVGRDRAAWKRKLICCKQNHGGTGAVGNTQLLEETRAAVGRQLVS